MSRDAMETMIDRSLEVLQGLMQGKVYRDKNNHSYKLDGDWKGLRFRGAAKGSQWKNVNDDFFSVVKFIAWVNSDNPKEVVEEPEIVEENDDDFWS